MVFKGKPLWPSVARKTMPQTRIAPYGSWKSPITSDSIVAGTVKLESLTIDGDDIYWVEGRPIEGGRCVIVRYGADGKTTDLTPAPFSVRTRVHEYGGGAYAIGDRAVYFSNDSDGRLYRQQPGERPQPLTPEMPWRYADAVIDRARNRLICVREDHREDAEPVNAIVSIDLQTGENELLVSGDDFYSSPRLSPDGSQLCWLSWNHPNMPWDETQLWVAEIRADGRLGKSRLAAGSAEESIVHPEWSPDGILHFVSDRNNWWNLYCWREGTIKLLCDKAAEFGLPHWVFGRSTYTFASASRIICTYTQAGNWYLASLDGQTQQLEVIETPYTDITSPRFLGGKVAFIGGSATEPTAIARWDVSTNKIEVLRRSTQLEIDKGYLSVPQAVEFPTENGLTAYGFFYPPQNRDYAAPEVEKPPLLVKSHGGPTAATSSAFSLKIQYWTSRGFAVLDVNYGGSTGYGKDYRQRLRDNWGIVDVDDCVNGTNYLVERGLVDGERLTISGGSAGGYTTLASLTFRHVFKAGASHYGISDLEVLARETHKFEARYFDRLIAPYPQRRDLYQQRSPIHFTDRLSCPVIFFQGLEDKVVPPNQAEMMVEVLKTKRLPVAYVTFEGEQHGFRKAENIKRALDGEFYFYSRVFGFEPAGDLEPVPIDNL